MVIGKKIHIMFLMTPLLTLGQWEAWIYFRDSTSQNSTWSIHCKVYLSHLQHWYDEATYDGNRSVNHLILPNFSLLGTRFTEYEKRKINTFFKLTILTVLLNGFLCVQLPVEKKFQTFKMEIVFYRVQCWKVAPWKAEQSYHFKGKYLICRSFLFICLCFNRVPEFVRYV